MEIQVRVRQLDSAVLAVLEIENDEDQQPVVRDFVREIRIDLERLLENVEWQIQRDPETQALSRVRGVWYYLKRVAPAGTKAAEVVARIGQVLHTYGVIDERFNPPTL